MQNKTNLNKTNYQEVFVSTLSEFLKLEKNQAIALDRIVEILRTSGSWGKRGLFVKVANDTGFSAAYVGQVLTGKKPLTDEFVYKLSDCFGVAVAYFRGEEELFDRNSQILEKIDKLSVDEKFDMVVNSLLSNDKELIINKLKTKVGFTDEEAKRYLGVISEWLGKHTLPDILGNMHIEIFKPLIDETFKMSVDETPIGEKELESLCADIGSKLDSEVLKPAIRELALMPASELPGIAAIIKRFRENQSFNLEARKLLNNSIAHSK